MNTLRVAAIAFCALVTVQTPLADAESFDPGSLRAARALIGATIKTQEFEAILHRVVQGFAKDITKNTEGADDKVVIRTLMDQARITISQNRGVYLEGIARVYAKHLSEGELRAAVKFFSSPEGRKWTVVQNKITRDTLQYAATMGGSLKSQIVRGTVEKLKQRGFKSKDN
ncbi:MAG: DUF2059 domain-containing protein [Hyphomicrobiales bacterium]